MQYKHIVNQPDIKKERNMNQHAGTKKPSHERKKEIRSARTRKNTIGVDNWGGLPNRYIYIYIHI